jgi:hypothetical protein
MLTQCHLNVLRGFMGQTSFLIDAEIDDRSGEVNGADN